MFLKTDYGAILGGLDAPMAKGIDDGAVSVFNARKIEKVVDAASGKSWTVVEA